MYVDLEVMDRFEELECIISNASSIPFSHKSGIDKEEVLELINNIKASLPEELKQAHWVNQERHKIINDSKQEALEIVEQAKKEAERIKEEYENNIEELKKKNILFLAGGVGTAPVYPKVKWLHEHGVDCDVIMGSRNKDLLILEDEMKKVATNRYVTTDDGSYGFKGTGTAQLQELWDNGNRYDHCVAIGPMIMMKFVCKLTKELGIPTVVSMNPIMVDGTGMCGACRLVVGDEVKFACVDGPEFDGHLVDFDQAMRRQAQYKTEEGRAMLKLQEGASHHGGCGNCNS